jgi:RHS repeat-associated protein
MRLSVREFCTRSQKFEMCPVWGAKFIKHLQPASSRQSATSSRSVGSFVGMLSSIPVGFTGRTNPWGTTDNILAKFTGPERDTETGLDFYQARYHDSVQGRFLSPDPAAKFCFP